MVPFPAESEHDVVAHETGVVTPEAGVDTAAAFDSVQAAVLDDAKNARGLRQRFHLYHGFYLLALVPALSMLGRVLESTRLQWYDYWTLLPRFTNPDGSLAVRRLLDQHEGHVLGLPRVIYWINYQMFAGSNVPLGVYVCIVAGAQVVLFSVVLPRRIRPSWRAGLTAAISVMLFAPQGVHNFARAMSGTAWITANLLVLLAVIAASRQRTAIAILLAALASVTYGTGLVAWPIVVLCLAFVGGATRRRLVAVVIAAAGMLIFYAANYEGASGSKPSLGPADVLRRTTQVLGAMLFEDPELAVAAGIAGVGVFAVLVWIVAHERRGADTWQVCVFIAIGAYGIIAALLIGGSRGGVFENDIGLSSRYASLSAMLWIAVVVLGASVVPRFSTVATVGALTVLSLVGGQGSLSDSQHLNVMQNELAIAIRLDTNEGWTYGSDDTPNSLLRALGHYPFVDSFDGDCGLLGSTIDTDDVRVDGNDVGALDGFLPAMNDKSLRMNGWFESPVGEVECIVFADENGLVVGAAAYGARRPDIISARAGLSGNRYVGFQGVVGTTEGAFRAYARVADDDRLHAIPGTLDSSADQH